MRRFPFDRLHHSARRQSRRHIQQQMHMIGSHMPLHDLDIQRSANLSRQVPHLFPDLSSQSRLAVLGDEHKVISQPIHCMRTFPILRHLRSVPPSLLKASPKGEGVHPSQSGTLRLLKEHGYIREAPTEKTNRLGRPRSPEWQVNPLVLTQNPQNTQKPEHNHSSEDSEDSVQVISVSQPAEGFYCSDEEESTDTSFSDDGEHGESGPSDDAHGNEETRTVRGTI